MCQKDMDKGSMFGSGGVGFAFLQQHSVFNTRCRKMGGGFECRVRSLGVSGLGEG